MSTRYTVEQRELITKIKTILGNALGLPASQALLLPVNKPLEEMMSSIQITDVLELLREEFKVELCWGRISENPTIDGILEVIMDETDGGYKCNSGK
jgi:hypothetical protein